MVKSDFEEEHIDFDSFLSKTMSTSIIHLSENQLKFILQMCIRFNNSTVFEYKDRNEKFISVDFPNLKCRVFGFKEITL